MWGHILTEASTQQNFNFGFSTYKSDILVHLSQWQYWWWFWFSIWWTLYYFIIIRVLTKRTFNFNVIMNTSIRGRGKWGDFLVALIPVSWCCNILINSNFILRMIEWQNESSLFTIRIQGKQWYWVYKYDPNTAQAVMNTPKNIGHNRWRVTSGQESYNADTYYQAIHLAAHLEFQDSYTKFTKKIDTHKKSLSKLSLTNDKLYVPSTWSTPTQTFSTIGDFNTLTSSLEFELLLNSNNDLTNEFQSKKLILSESTIDLETFYNKKSSYKYIFNNHNNPTQTSSTIGDFDALTSALEFELLLNSNNDSTNESESKNLTLSQSTLDSETFYNKKSSYKYKFNTHNNINLLEVFYSNSENMRLSLNNFFNNNNFNAYYDFLQLDETSDADSNSRHQITTQPFRLIKGILNQHVVDILQDTKFLNIKLNKLLFLNTKFYQTGESLADKGLMPETLWGFRQKRYKRLKKFKFKPEVIYDPVTFAVIGQKNVTLSPKVDIAGLDTYTFSLDNKKQLDSEDITFKERVRSINDSFNYRLATKINRHRSELVPVTLARRLLRTKRTLVLPAHVNLTLITNSYDVVHSWFVPGLGLKLDCVPGRSTHHTFFIDNIGFYYGQCAEICGRYHHHMPIRLCALPFEHFVVWWQSKGLARMNRTSEINTNKYLQHTFNNPITREKLIFKMN